MEVRSHELQSQSILESLNDPPTAAAVTAERSLLATLQAGCLAPVATWGRIHQGQLLLDAIVLSSDGSQRLLAQARGAIQDAVEIGQTAARQLLDQGAAPLIADAHTQDGRLR